MNTSMNKSVKMILAGLAIAALSASVYARGGDCDYGPGYGGHGGMMGWDPAKMEKYHEQHLAKLHDKLKLTAPAGTGMEEIHGEQPDGGQGCASRPG